MGDLLVLDFGITKEMHLVKLLTCLYSMTMSMGVVAFMVICLDVIGHLCSKPQSQIKKKLVKKCYLSS